MNHGSPRAPADSLALPPQPRPVPPPKAARDADLYSGLSPQLMEQAAAIDDFFASAPAPSAGAGTAPAAPVPHSTRADRTRGPPREPQHEEPPRRLLRCRRGKDRGEGSRGREAEMGMALDTPNSSPVRRRLLTGRSGGPRSRPNSMVLDTSSTAPRASEAGVLAVQGGSGEGLFSPLTSMFAETGLGLSAWAAAVGASGAGMQVDGPLSSSSNPAGFDFTMPFASASPVPSPSRYNTRRQRGTASSAPTNSAMAPPSSDVDDDRSQRSKRSRSSASLSVAGSAPGSHAGSVPRADQDLEYDRYLWSSPHPQAGASSGGLVGATGQQEQPPRARPDQLPAGTRRQSPGVPAAQAQLAALQRTSESLMQGIQGGERPAGYPAQGQQQTVFGTFPGAPFSSASVGLGLPIELAGQASSSVTSGSSAAGEDPIKRSLKRRREVSDPVAGVHEPGHPSGAVANLRSSGLSSASGHNRSQNLSEESNTSFATSGAGSGQLHFAFDSPVQSPASSVSSYNSSASDSSVAERGGSAAAFGELCWGGAGDNWNASTQSLPVLGERYDWTAVARSTSQSASTGSEAALAYLDVPVSAFAAQQQGQSASSATPAGSEASDARYLTAPAVAETSRPAGEYHRGGSARAASSQSASSHSTANSRGSSPGGDCPFAKNQSPQARRTRKDVKGKPPPTESYQLAPPPLPRRSRASRPRPDGQAQPTNHLKEEQIPEGASQDAHQAPFAEAAQPRASQHQSQDSRTNQSRYDVAGFPPIAVSESAPSTASRAAQRPPSEYHLTPAHPSRAPLRRAQTAEGMPLPPTPDSLPHTGRAPPTSGGGKRLEQQAMLRRASDNGVMPPPTVAASAQAPPRQPLTWDSPTGALHLRPPRGASRRSRGSWASDSSGASPASSHFASASPSPLASPASASRPAFLLPSPNASPNPHRRRRHARIGDKISLGEALAALDELTEYLSEQASAAEYSDDGGPGLATREHFFTLGELRGRIRRRLEVEEAQQRAAAAH